MLLFATKHKDTWFSRSNEKKAAKSIAFLFFFSWEGLDMQSLFAWRKICFIPVLEKEKACPGEDLMAEMKKNIFF